MKQLNSMFKPRIVLLATALTVAGVVGAQTTGTATDSAASTSAASAQSTTPAVCSGKEGTALSDCLKLNAAANNNASTNTSATQKMDASTSATTSATQTDASNAQSSAGATNNASTSMDSSANATQKATAAKRAAGTNADQMNVNVASATPRTHSRASARNAAKSSAGDTPYRAELRNCVQQSADQRESCLDRAIENHGRTQSG